MKQLRDFLDKIHPLNDESFERLSSCFREIRFKKKEIITAEGQIEKRMYFVLDGVQRSYFLKDGKEHVIAFTYPPSFSGIPESFITQTPSKYYLDCITDSKMLLISYEQLQKLMNEDREIERLLRKATEQVLAGLILRHHELLALNIESRFKALMQRSPHLLMLVPHKHIASYLGIDSTNFSKLLGKVKI